MAMIRKSFSDLENPRFEWTDEDRARLLQLSDHAIDNAAAADPDAQPAGDDDLDRAVTGRCIRRVREMTGLSQSQFAARYHVDLDRLQDFEAGRFLADSAFLAYLSVIEREPEAVARALDGVNSAL
jgi:putative transcriptional regulator